MCTSIFCPLLCPIHDLSVSPQTYKCADSSVEQGSRNFSGPTLPQLCVIKRKPTNFCPQLCQKSSRFNAEFTFRFNKKLSRCRWTAQRWRTINTKYRTWKTCNRRMSGTDALSFREDHDTHIIWLSEIHIVRTTTTVHNVCCSCIAWGRQIRDLKSNSDCSLKKDAIRVKIHQLGQQPHCSSLYLYGVF